ncbi:MAG: hypothetical protein PHF34_05380 [Bacteroidales bacterium]|nr:hypothetical protein [Bacteroidales bacterium]
MIFNIFDHSVRIIFSDNISKDDISNAYLCRPHLKVNNQNLWLDIYNIAQFYVHNGEKIVIQPYKNAEPDSIELFLNGSALGAILHQRGIMPFHGSAFNFIDKGILICGTSGSGKSSVTAAFCQNGAQFLSDDITPVSLYDSKIFIEPLKTRMKLWDDSIEKLNLKNKNLKRIRPTLDKYYVPYPEDHKKHLLNHLVILGVHNQPNFQAQEINNLEKYNALRGQIYRKTYLKGMPETEKKYFKQILQIASAITVTMVFRPKMCEIYETMDFIKKAINV